MNAHLLSIFILSCSFVLIVVASCSCRELARPSVPRPPKLCCFVFSFHISARFHLVFRVLSLRPHLRSLHRVYHCSFLLLAVYNSLVCLQSGDSGSNIRANHGMLHPFCLPPVCCCALVLTASVGCVCLGKWFATDSFCWLLSLVYCSTVCCIVALLLLFMPILSTNLHLLIGEGGSDIVLFALYNSL